jgi:hypothetical protein
MLSTSIGILLGSFMIVLSWALLLVTAISMGGDRFFGYVALATLFVTAFGMWLIARSVTRLRKG